MFKRTPQGLSNEHLFYNVGLVVYCEGKIREDGSSTFDELFWSSLLTTLGVNAEIKSVGSKSNVLSLADDLMGQNLQNILLCVDRDYDDFYDKVINHPAIWYTFGYSWESDAIQLCDFGAVLNLFVNAIDSTAERQELERYVAALTSTMRRVCVLDIKYFNESTALFDREKPQSILTCSRTAAPAFNISKILRAAKGMNSDSRFYIDYINFDPLKVFFGKCVAKIVYHWFCDFSRKLIYGRTVNYDTFLSVLARGIHVGESDVFPYYREKLASLARFRAV